MTCLISHAKILGHVVWWGLVVMMICQIENQFIVAQCSQAIVVVYTCFVTNYTKTQSQECIKIRALLH